MGRDLLFLGGLVSAVVLSVAVEPTQAASVDVGSTMTATGVGPGGSNSTVDLVLDVEGEFFMEKITLFGNDTWTFQSLEGVWAQGAAVSWDAKVGPGDLHILVTDADGAFDPEPMRIRVNMATWGEASDFVEISYTANGYALANPSAEQIISGTAGYSSTSGTVIPEPATAAVLGAGFVGLLARGRRTCL